MTKNSHIKQAILATLNFYDLFDFPLTNFEIFDNLWRCRAENSDVFACLDELKLHKSINFSEGFYFLPGREQIVSIRQKRYLDSFHKKQQLIREKWLFSLAPFVDNVAIANTLAYSNAKQQGDIDILVVTRPGRIFTARIFLTFWLLMFNRWRHGQSVKNKYCLSFFLSSDNLDLSRLKFPDTDDIYLSYWTKWLTPYYCTDKKAEETYFQNNSWIKTNLPNTNFFNTNLYQDQKSYFARFFELLLHGGLGDVLEKILHQMMLYKIKNKTKEFHIDGTIASDQILKFHPNGKRREYEQKWLKQIKNPGNL